MLAQPPRAGAGFLSGPKPLSGPSATIAGMAAISELASVTPREARAMARSPAALDAWMARVRMARPPAGFFGALALLAAEAEFADHEEKVARQAAAVRSEANRRRRDLGELRALVEGARDRIPPRMRAVAELCLEEGRSAAEAGAALAMSAATVRTHLQRLRAIARRNRPDEGAAPGARSSGVIGRHT